MSKRVTRTGWIGFWAVALMLVAAGAAWACTDQAVIGTPGAGSDGGSALSPESGPSGTLVLVEGREFYEREVEIRWDSTNGPLLATAHGPEFETEFTAPDRPAGDYTVLAIVRDQNGEVDAVAQAPFRLTADREDPNGGGSGSSSGSGSGSSDGDQVTSGETDQNASGDTSTRGDTSGETSGGAEEGSGRTTEQSAGAPAPDDSGQPADDTQERAGDDSEQGGSASDGADETAASTEPGSASAEDRDGAQPEPAPVTAESGASQPAGETDGSQPPDGDRAATDPTTSDRQRGPSDSRLTALGEWRPQPREPVAAIEEEARVPADVSEGGASGDLWSGLRQGSDPAGLGAASASNVPESAGSSTGQLLTLGAGLLGGGALLLLGLGLAFVRRRPARAMAPRQ